MLIMLDCMEHESSNVNCCSKSPFTCADRHSPVRTGGPDVNVTQSRRRLSRSVLSGQAEAALYKSSTSYLNDRMVGKLSD